MLTFTDDEFKRQIQDEVGIKPEWAAEAFPDLDEDVRQSIARIKASPFIPKKELGARLRLRRERTGSCARSSEACWWALGGGGSGRDPSPGEAVRDTIRRTGEDETFASSVCASTPAIRVHRELLGGGARVAPDPRRAGRGRARAAGRESRGRGGARLCCS